MGADVEHRRGSLAVARGGFGLGLARVRGAHLVNVLPGELCWTKFIEF